MIKQITLFWKKKQLLCFFDASIFGPLEEAASAAEAVEDQAALIDLSKANKPSAYIMVQLQQMERILRFRLVLFGGFAGWFCLKREGAFVGVVEAFSRKDFELICIAFWFWAGLLKKGKVRMLLLSDDVLRQMRRFRLSLDPCRHWIPCYEAKKAERRQWRSTWRIFYGFLLPALGFGLMAHLGLHWVQLCDRFFKYPESGWLKLEHQFPVNFGVGSQRVHLCLIKNLRFAKNF